MGLECFFGGGATLNWILKVLGYTKESSVLLLTGGVNCWTKEIIFALMPAQPRLRKRLSCGKFWACVLIFKRVAIPF